MKSGDLYRSHIVVIGGGFAGLNFAKRLFKNEFYEVTVVDQNNYNYFTPLLYQVATSFLEPSSISYPFRKLFKGKGIRFRNASLLRVAPSTNTLYLSDGGELEYDYLVFAAGSDTNFFGNESVRSKAVFLKGIDDALRMRNKLIRTLEHASIETDSVERQKHLNIVVAGGGATGIEVVGMLAEMKKRILAEYYPELSYSSAGIYLIEGGPNLLGPMSDRSHQDAFDALAKLDVHVKLNTQVTLYENDRVYLSDGETIDAKTLVWSAGVIARQFQGIADESLGRGKRMVTDSFNRVHGYVDIYAIGDISIQFGDQKYPGGHPQLAQPAIQQGKALARNFLRLAKGQPLKPFRYFDRGEMAIIGRHTAVADLFKHKVHFRGLPALLSWLFIHIISLVNYNNKIKTFYNWAVAYLTCDQSLRMIFYSGRRENGGKSRRSARHSIRDHQLNNHAHAE